jgi:hypothetical protein
MFSNNISQGKSVFHKSIHSGNSNSSTVGGDKFQELFDGLEGRMANALSKVLSKSENRTVSLIKNALLAAVNSFPNTAQHSPYSNDFSNPTEINEFRHLKVETATGNFQSSKDEPSLPEDSIPNYNPPVYNPPIKPIKLINSTQDDKVSAKISQLNEPYATIVQLITDKINKSEQNITSAISVSDSNTQTGMFSVTQSLSQTNNLVIGSNSQLNNVLTQSNSKIDSIASNVQALSISVSEISTAFNNLLSNTISQISSSINASISKSESNLLIAISNNMSNGICDPTFIQNEIKTAISNSEAILVKNQLYTDDLINAMNNRINYLAG